VREKNARKIKLELRPVSGTLRRCLLDQFPDWALKKEVKMEMS
jgi:hypothetical protein